MIHYKNKGFTIVELLVVIAVIGFLASVILVSMQGVREKARIAKGLDFSHSIQHILGAYAVGWWNFETIEADRVIDGSGYGKHGTIYGATLVSGLEQLGNALSFDGNDYVSVQPILTGNSAFTAEAWVRPADTGAWRTVFAEGCSGFDLAITGGIIRFGRNCGGPFGVFYSGPAMTINQWAHVVISFDGTNVDMYKNGKKYSGGPVTYTHSYFYIGSYSGSSEFFTGLIDEVRVYERALSVTEIQKHYADGLKTHKNLAVK